MYFPLTSPAQSQTKSFQKGHSHLKQQTNNSYMIEDYSSLGHGILEAQ